MNAQEYVFQNITNNDQRTIMNVQLYPDGSAIMVSDEVELFYDGNNVTVLPTTEESYINVCSSLIEKDGKRYGICTKRLPKSNGSYLFSWNDSIKEFVNTGFYDSRSGYFELTKKMEIFYFTDTCFYKVNFKDTSLELIKSCHFNYPNFDILIDLDSSLIFVLNNFKADTSRLYYYNYDTMVEISERLNYMISKSCTFDNENYYFLAGNNSNGLIHWNSKTLNTELIYYNDSVDIENLIHYNYKMYMISDKDILFCGYGGIAKIDISKKTFDFYKYDHYTNFSYCSSLDKAMFVGYNGLITEMFRMDDVLSFIENKHVNIYPNPADNQLFVDTHHDIKEIEIFNNLGQEVITTNLSQSIDISNLNTGIYFIKLLFNSGKTSIAKFVKN